MITTIVMATVLGVLVVGFLAFYLYSRTPEWGDSDFRKSMLGFLVAIAPMWGMRYKPPHHETPAVTTRGEEREPLPLQGAEPAEPLAVRGGEAAEPLALQGGEPAQAAGGSPVPWGRIRRRRGAGRAR